MAIDTSGRHSDDNWALYRWYVDRVSIETSTDISIDVSTDVSVEAAHKIHDPKKF